VRDLGVCLDAELTMKPHISRVASSCFFQLRRLRQIRRSVGEEVTKRLVTALVLSRLDYCNVALTCLPESTMRPLQRVQNAAALLVTNAKSSDQYEYTVQRREGFVRSGTKVLFGRAPTLNNPVALDAFLNVAFPLSQHGHSRQSSGAATSCLFINTLVKEII
jgi:hypothetical protein